MIDEGGFSLAEASKIDNCIKRRNKYKKGNFKVLMVNTKGSNFKNRGKNF